jgi:hypothetical protein
MQTTAIDNLATNLFEVAKVHLFSEDALQPQ